MALPLSSTRVSPSYLSPVLLARQTPSTVHFPDKIALISTIPSDSDAVAARLSPLNLSSRPSSFAAIDEREEETLMVAACQKTFVFSSRCFQSSWVSSLSTNNLVVASMTALPPQPQLKPLTKPLHGESLGLEECRRSTCYTEGLPERSEAPHKPSGLTSESAPPSLVDLGHAGSGIDDLLIEASTVASCKSPQASEKDVTENAVTPSLLFVETDLAVSSSLEVPSSPDSVSAERGKRDQDMSEHGKAPERSLRMKQLPSPGRQRRRTLAAVLYTGLLVGLLSWQAEPGLARAFSLFGQPSVEKDPIEPFTIYASVFKKYLIENIVDGRIVSRKKGFTASVCVNILEESRETPQLQGVPAGLKVNLIGEPACAKGEGQTREESCTPPCERACEAAISRHAIKMKEASGYAIEAGDRTKVLKGCSTQCKYECTKPGNNISFVLPFRL
eukprot:TRINITY_DN2159_c0_g1_i4.p1 TRINITY_DN2159_c0_g1~~TRINITY_DN2159_c0_g1_i4.p1  ORF type:complete len:446 (+),score=36.47 TRINITY_DN2159_c0_g1_i4:941-2278(+)